MINQITVRNFRSIKDLDLSLTLSNVLVGPNASGKTNLLDVFKFLRDMAAGGLGRAFSERLGYREVAWKGADTGPIHIVLSAELSEQASEKYLVEYEIEVEGTAAGLLTLLRERLTAQNRGRLIDLIDFRSGRGAARHLDGSKAFDAPQNPAQSALEFNVPGWEGTRFRDYMAGWRFHHLDPQAMKQVNPAGRATFLSESGDNLAAWLATLKTSYSEYFRRIEQSARDAFPGLEEILTELTQFQTTFLSSRDKYLRQPVHVWGLSAGELCFIALASLILCPPELGSSATFVEEVENNLNPRLIKVLFTILEQWQDFYKNTNQATQVFMTTHSPYVVDQFKLDDLIVIEKHQGASVARRASDKQNLRDLLANQETGLGDLWFSGALGGI